MTVKDVLSIIFVSSSLAGNMLLMPYLMNKCFGTFAFHHPSFANNDVMKGHKRGYFGLVRALAKQGNVNFKLGES